MHDGGTYLCMEGPQFSTRAESEVYRQWGMDVIGMTNLQEAKLAREAEICYATLALVTDYDCWHEEEEDVSGEAVMEVIRQNVLMAQAVVRNVVGPARRPAAYLRVRGCPRARADHRALDDPDVDAAEAEADRRPVHRGVRTAS